MIWSKCCSSDSSNKRDDTSAYSTVDIMIPIQSWIHHVVRQGEWGEIFFVVLSHGWDRFMCNVNLHIRVLHLTTAMFCCVFSRTLHHVLVGLRVLCKVQKVSSGHTWWVRGAPTGPSRALYFCLNAAASNLFFKHRALSVQMQEETDSVELFRLVQ